jgi:hypothetical protein
MAWYSTDIWISRIDEVDLGLVVTARTLHVDKIVQCYVSGELADWQRPEGGQVRFVLPQAGPNDAIFLLAVDSGSQRTNYWSEAFGAGNVHGNRIQVKFRRDMRDGRAPGDVWRVYRGDAGGVSAAIRIHEAEIHPGGRGATGWGFDWGYGGWGYSGSNAPGWGRHWGYAWGFGIDYLTYTTQPLARGAYPVKVEVEDRHGNVSPAFETSVVVDTYARPAGGLAVNSYAKATDTLVLALTPSEDIA